MKATMRYDMRRRIIRDTETFLAGHARRPAPTALVLRAAEQDMDRIIAAEACGSASVPGRGR